MGAVRRFPYPRPCRWAALVFLGLSVGVLLFDSKVARGGPGNTGIPPSLCYQGLRDHFEALRAFVVDPVAVSFLEDRIATQAIWHIATVRNDSNEWLVEVFTAGKGRNTTRVFRTTFLRIPKSGGGSRYTFLSQDFSQMPLRGVSCASTRNELEILLSAFSDAGVRGMLLDSFENQIKRDVASVKVMEDGQHTSYQFVATSVALGNEEPVVLTWRVERSSQGWQFSD